ncbi:PadR family transcriptional regulator [Actinoplanes sp. TFC3]|uniref:PadR family transcriptional regulator n=1 Tax=Actinoplanes sp. TFC3 TaxID=1710355 RepID=UPI000831D2FE|nr:PadR family transcriptional regulator [Actinoplanes sp. TFC3]
MQEPTFWILTALAQQPRHGYGIFQSVVQLTDGGVKLQPGTLYAALDRLTAQGDLEIDHEEVVDGRPRRYYRLTERGAAALARESERLALKAATARLVLSARAGGVVLE